MACDLCCLYGEDTHSFKEICRSERFGRIIYTCISKAKDYSNTKAILSHVNNILSKENTSWLWVFDCRDLKMKHTVQIDVAVNLSTTIRDKYSHNLQRIILLNPTKSIDMLIKHILPIFNPDAINYLRKYKGSPLEIYLSLKNEGIEESCVNSIIGKIRE
jgi:hypothetical protein